MRRKTLAAVGAAVVLVGLTVAAWFLVGTTPPAWATADEVVLYSVDGRYKPAPGPTGETLHGYPVLGKVEVTDPAERRRLAAAFAAATTQPVTQTKCFWPRHVLRVKQGGVATDYVICFECRNYERRVGGDRLDKATQPIAPSARPAFDAPLVAAGVPLPPAADPASEP